MGMYSDKLCETIPVIKRVLQKKGEMIYCNIEVEQWAKEYYDLEYLKPVWEYLESIEGNICDKCYFLITEEEAIGTKAAFAVLNYPVYEGGAATGHNNGVEKYRSEQKTKKSDKLLAFFSSKSDYAAWIHGMEDMSYTYFTGLDEGDMNELELKLQCIMSCGSRMKFVQMKFTNSLNSFLIDTMRMHYSQF